MKTIPYIPYDVGAEGPAPKYEPGPHTIVDLGNGETYDMNTDPPKYKLKPIVFKDGTKWTPGE